MRKLKLNATDNKKILSVGNKIDLIPPEKWSEVMGQGYLPISAVRGFGLEHLVEKIEKQLIISTDRVKLRMRLRPGSEEWEWLRQNSSFGASEVDGDTNYNIVTVVISKHILDKFKAKYLK